MTEKGSGQGSEVFLTAKQVADRYGMCRTWPYHSEDLKPLRRRIGKRAIRWALSDLIEFEKSEGQRAADFRYFKENGDFKRNKRFPFGIM